MHFTAPLLSLPGCQVLFAIYKGCTAICPGPQFQEGTGTKPGFRSSHHGTPIFMASILSQPCCYSSWALRKYINNPQVSSITPRSVKPSNGIPNASSIQKPKRQGIPHDRESSSGMIGGMVTVWKTRRSHSCFWRAAKRILPWNQKMTQPRASSLLKKGCSPIPETYKWQEIRAHCPQSTMP